MLISSSKVHSPLLARSYERGASATPVPQPDQSLVQDHFIVSETKTTSTISTAKVDENPTKWHKEQIIYFPLTDRFHDGDPTNNFLVDRNHPAGFHGGDLKGLTQKLDYIKSLGATSVWLSPLADNTNEMRLGNYHGYGHHGYWIKDHYGVEEHQGNLTDAKNLVQEAHKKGLKVILDVVLNHVGPDHSFLSDPAKKNWFHNEGGIDDWNDQNQVERRDLGGLPDLAQENPETYKYLVDNTLWWIKETGVDGIRLDAVKHIPKEFWSKFVAEIKEKSGKEDLFVTGEVFHGDTRVVSEYQKAGIDSVFDLPLYYTMRETLGQGQSFRRLGERLAEDRNYPDPSQLVTVLDNHDLPRFLSTAKNSFPGERDQRLKQAMAFQMTVRGMPSVYYGTESGFSGGDDPHNREMMDFQARPDLRGHLQKLTAFRNESAALKSGAQREIWSDDDVYGFSRQSGQDEVVALFHNGTNKTARQIPLLPNSPWAQKQSVTDILSGREFPIKDGKIEVELEPLTPLLLK